MWFTSDNASAAAPEILAALSAANTGFERSYGAEDAMAQVTARIRETFEAPEAAVYLVATGTAANALALGCLCPPWATIYCHRIAHIEEDECGAPEFYTGGAKLTLIEGEHGRMSPGALKSAIAHTARAGVHNIQRGALSLTNTTEAGTLYGGAEIAALSAVASEYGLPTHLDGARFANAVAALGCAPAELSWKAGVDILSFGGTKNGLLGVEAVVIFDPSRAWEFELRRKRGGHLFSKHRYLSAQMAAYLADGLWLTLAGQANAMAARLASGLTARGAFLLHDPQANIVFAQMERGRLRHASEQGAQFYLWPFDQTLEGCEDEPVSVRLVCSWCHRPEEIDAFLSHL